MTTIEQKLALQIGTMHIQIAQLASHIEALQAENTKLKQEISAMKSGSTSAGVSDRMVMNGNDNDHDHGSGP